MNDETYERLLAQYTPLLKKVLLRCRVYQHHPDYEDYQQILRFALFQKAQVMDLTDPTKAVINQLFSFFMWKVRDEQRLQKRAEEIVEKALQLPYQESCKPEITVFLCSELAACWPELTVGERRYLTARLQAGWSAKEISAYYQVSHTAVMKWRQKLKQRLQVEE